MTTIKYRFSFKYNRIIGIDHTRVDDQKIAEYIYREISTHEREIDPPVKIESILSLDKLLDDIIADAKLNRSIPILIFDGHGTKKGLSIGDEIYQWENLCIRLREINILTKNNLVVLFASCYSSAIYQNIISLSDVTPFYYSFAPLEKISQSEISTIITKVITGIISGNGSDEFVGDSTEKLVIYSSEKYLYKIFCILKSETTSSKKFHLWTNEFIDNARSLLAREIDIDVNALRQDFKKNGKNLKPIFNSYMDSFLMASDSENHARYMNNFT